MAEIAALAGLSESTVSRALAGSRFVNADTRRRVKALAQELGYRVNPVARSLRSRKARTIGVMIPLQHDEEQQPSDSFLLGLLGGIADALAERDYDLLLSPPRSDIEEWISRCLGTGQAGGVIVLGQSYHHELLNEAAGRGAAMVVWGADVAGRSYATVGSDNRAAGRAAAVHLIGAGRRKLAFLGDVRLPEVAQRYQGFRDALAAAEIDPGAAPLVSVHFGASQAYAEAVAFLGGDPDIDGIFAASDVIGMGAIRALGAAGHRVPGDVAVVGFDDVPLAEVASPPLTTLRQNSAKGAAALVELLLDQIAGRPAKSVVIPAELVVRGSTVPGA